MRSLVKGDSGPIYDEEQEAEACRRARRRHRIRRVIALGCIAMATFFAYQYFRGWLAASAEGLVAAPDWTDHAEVLAWLRGRARAVSWHARAALSGALPAGDVRLILKVAVCAVSGAVFLRMPRRV